MADGDEVVYRNGDGTAVGGLIDGATYYVIVDNASTVKLAATKAEAIKVEIDLTSAGTGTGHEIAPLFGDVLAVTSVASGNNTITFAADHGLTDGDEVVYRNGDGTVIGGLVDGATYYVIVVTSSTVKLAATKAAAVKVAIDLTSAGTGTGHEIAPRTIELSIAGLQLGLPGATNGSGQIISVTAAGAGGKNTAGAGAIALNFVRMDVDAHISNTGVGKSITAGGNVTVLHRTARRSSPAQGRSQSRLASRLRSTRRSA